MEGETKKRKGIEEIDSQPKKSKYEDSQNNNNNDENDHLENEIEVLIILDSVGYCKSGLTGQEKSKAESLFQQLFKDIPNLKFGIAFQKDYREGPPEAFTCQKPTNNVTDIVNFVFNHRNEGGWTYETHEFALRKLQKYEWNSENSVKKIVWHTRAAPHPTAQSTAKLKKFKFNLKGNNLRYGISLQGLNWKKELEKLAQVQPKISIHTFYRKTECTKDGIEYAKEVTKTTNGYMHNIKEWEEMPFLIKGLFYRFSDEISNTTLLKGFIEELLALQAEGKNTVIINPTNGYSRELDFKSLVQSLDKNVPSNSQ